MHPFHFLSQPFPHVYILLQVGDFLLQLLLVTQLLELPLLLQHLIVQLLHHSFELLHRLQWRLICIHQFVDIVESLKDGPLEFVFIL